MIQIKDIQGNIIYSSEINKGAKRKLLLMKEDYIVLPFSLESPIDFGLGCYAEVDGIRYEVVDYQKPNYNSNTGGYDYQLRLDAYYWKWKNKIFKFTPETGGQEASWSLTASLDVHLGIFLKNLSALGYKFNDVDFEFSIDASVENKAVSMTYANTNMIDALSAMAESWSCEWWITDNIVHLGRCEYGTAVDFEIHKNVAEMTRSESQSQYATRLYVFGSTRNLPSNYRPLDESVVVNGVVQRRLMLPADTPYIDAYENMSEEEAIEEVVILDDIYPRFDGNISSVEEYESSVENEDGTTSTETFYCFKDDGFTFSKDYILEGQELKVRFESGSLNGMEFDAVFNPNGADEASSDAQLFEIVASEDYGRKLPDAILHPKIGDKYVLIGWDSTKIADLGLVSKAEAELLTKAQELSAKRKIDPSTYNCKMFSDYMYGLDEDGSQDSTFAKNFELGDKVKLINSAYFENGRESRIIGYEYNLDFPYDNPVYTIGETASYSRLGALESKLESLTYGGHTYTGGSGSGVYVIGLNDTTKPSSRNVYSALRSDSNYLSKTKDDRSKGTIASDKGFVVGENKGVTMNESNKEVTAFIDQLKLDLEGKRGLFKDSESIITAILDKLKEVLSIQSQSYTKGEFGNGFILKYENGKSYFEVDEMLVRRVAYFVELVIKQLSHVGGTLVLSPASMRCSKVEEFEEYYRCYFESERDGKTINQEFVAGDQARAQSFNVKEGVNQNAQNQYYWRLVVATGDDYIDLSKIDCDSSSLPPKAGDDIVQLGNRYDSTRQNAIILSTIGEDAPSFKQYKGISTYSLAGKEKIVISPKGNVITGDFVSKTGFDLEGSINDLGVRLDDVVNQTDKTYMIWFYDYEPTLENYPVSEWLDDTVRAEHIEDIFYNQDSGRAYRFKQSMDGSFLWVEITDHETIKALEKAAEALKTAESKMQNFVTQPIPPYNVGDRWSNAVYTNEKGVVLYDNDELVCITPKGEKENFSIDDWQVVSAVSSSDKRYFYSEFERLDTELKSVVADGKTQEESIKKADAAAKAAQDAANTADTKATQAATAISQTKDFVSTIAVAFEVDENGDLVLDDNGSPKITSSAGSVITSEVAKLYATKTTTNALSSSITQAQSDITAVSDRITALSEKITTDKDGNITNISKSGLVLDTEFATLFSERVTADGIAKTATIKAYVDDKVSKIEITADKIDLTGVITMDMFSDGLKDDLNDTYCKIGEVSADDLATSLNDLINGKADDADLGTLAKKNSVSKDDLSLALKTLIDGKEDSSNIKGMAYYDNVLEALDAQTTVAGGFITTSMIDVDNLYVKNLVSTDSYGGKLISSGGKLMMFDKDGYEWLNIYGSGSLVSIRVGYEYGVKTLIQKNAIYCHGDSTFSSFSHQGVYLGFEGSIRQMALGNIHTDIYNDTDFVIGGGGTYTLPLASTHKGKMVFVKLTETTTIRSLSPIYKANAFNTLTQGNNGYYSDSYAGRSMFFISDGSNWYEFSSWYR